MIRINLNDMAVRISKKEGGYKNLNISDIKEVMKLVFEELTELTTLELHSLVDRYR